jgi:dihydroxyacetone kinase-like protein
MSELTAETIRRAILRFEAGVERAAPELNELDGALGDGDLGITLTLAAERLKNEVSNIPDDLGMALMRCAQCFTGVSGSTYGTLLATGLMAAAKATKGKTGVPWPELSPLLAAAVQAMSNRSKGELGDKTVLDAIEAARSATAGLAEPRAIAAAACDAINSALEQFRTLPFRQGRARIFGEKGIGRDDPGMVAFLRIVEIVGA